MASPPLLVISDVHLGPIAPDGAETALEALLCHHPGRELVVLGDLFDLSALPATTDPGSALARRMATQVPLAKTLRRHLLADAGVTLVAGNHDVELAVPGARAKILEVLDLPADVRLQVEPWWLRRAGLYLEHGHVWDPDNAPIHPLAPSLYEHEPLGIALTRRVVAPTGAFLFAHAHQTTPLAGLLRAVRELGFRAPEVILRYFIAGATLFWQALGDGPSRAEQKGKQLLADFAKRQQFLPSLLSELLDLRPLPRQSSARAVFARLYLDRALATVVSTIALTWGLVALETSALLLAAAGGAYLAGSKGDRAHRYSASLLERLRSAANQVAPLVEAKIVLFGHTHVPEAHPGYVNTGAFGFPGRDGRPYLLVDPDGTMTRGYLDTQNNPRLIQLPLDTR